jgi:hypothetical protein
MVPCICAHDMNAVPRKAQEAEARKKANAGAISSNVADRLLNANKVPTIRTGPTFLSLHCYPGKFRHLLRQFYSELNVLNNLTLSC